MRKICSSQPDLRQKPVACGSSSTTIAARRAAPWARRRSSASFEQAARKPLSLVARSDHQAVDRPPPAVPHRDHRSDELTIVVGDDQSLGVVAHEPGDAIDVICAGWFCAGVGPKSEHVVCFACQARPDGDRHRHTVWARTLITEPRQCRPRIRLRHPTGRRRAGAHQAPPAASSSTSFLCEVSPARARGDKPTSGRGVFRSGRLPAGP